MIKNASGEKLKGLCPPQKRTGAVAIIFRSSSKDAHKFTRKYQKLALDSLMKDFRPEEARSIFSGVCPRGLPPCGQR